MATDEVTTLRTIVGLTLALVVAMINGCSGIGYTVGGEFEVAFKGAVDRETRDDPRWQSKQEGTETTMSPADGMAALSLLAESKLGRFGLFLQLLCSLQLIGGLLVLLRPAAGTAAFIFLILLAIAGVSAEVIGAQYSSAWGITNILGVIVSVLLIPVALNMYKNDYGRD